MARIPVKQRGSKLLSVFFFLARKLLRKLLYLFFVMQPWKAKIWWHFVFDFQSTKKTRHNQPLFGGHYGRLTIKVDVFIYQYIYIFSVASQMMTSTFEVETCDPYVRHETHHGRQSLASLFDYTPNVYLLACWTLTIKYFEARNTYLSKYLKHLFHTFSTNNSEGKQR